MTFVKPTKQTNNPLCKMKKKNLSNMIVYQKQIGLLSGKLHVSGFSQDQTNIGWKRAESDGGRYLNSNIVIPFCLVWFCLKVSTTLKIKRIGKEVMKTHFTPHGYDAGLSGPVLATGLKSTIETKE